MDKEKMIEEIAKIIKGKDIIHLKGKWENDYFPNIAAKRIYNAGYRKPGVCEWQPSKKIGNKEIGDGWFDTNCGCTLNGDIKNYDPIYCLNCGNRIKIVEGEDG